MTAPQTHVKTQERALMGSIRTIALVSLATMAPIAKATSMNVPLTRVKIQVFAKIQ